MKHEDTQGRLAHNVFNAFNANNACWSITNLLSKYANNYTLCILKISVVIRAPVTRAILENLQSIVLVCDSLCWGHTYLNNVYTEFLKGRRILFGDFSCRQIRDDSPYMLMSGTVDGWQRELNAEGSTTTRRWTCSDRRNVALLVVTFERILHVHHWNHTRGCTDALSNNLQGVFGNEYLKKSVRFWRCYRTLLYRPQSEHLCLETTAYYKANSIKIIEALGPIYLRVRGTKTDLSLKFLTV
jgi:hypothetical protein